MISIAFWIKIIIITSSETDDYKKVPCSSADATSPMTLVSGRFIKYLIQVKVLFYYSRSMWLF